MGDREKIVIGNNLRFLRKRKGLTQQELADKLGIRRSSIGAYEENRASPRYETLEAVSDFFGVSIDLLVREDLSQLSEDEFLEVKKGGRADISGKKIRILQVAVDNQERENILFVPQKASAGYLNGYGDREYIEELPRFYLPMLGSGSYRAFEIKGDSMLPLKSGTIVIGEYLENWRDIKDSQTYVVISDTEGVVYKRIFNRINSEGSGELLLKSDNPLYPPYTIKVEEVREVWKAKMFMSSDFPEPDISLEKLSAIVMDIQKEVIKMKGDD